MKNYSHLKRQYPGYISLDQFHKICKIAKRSAKYLVDSGIVPAIDSGKKTHRYQIAIEDVIAYLRRRDREGSMIPTGLLTSGQREPSTRVSFSRLVELGEENQVAEFFQHITTDYPDVLTVADIVKLSGIGKSTILKMLEAGHLKSITNSPKHLIPKAYLFEFVATRRFLALSSDSDAYREVLESFEVWRSQK